MGSPKIEDYQQGLVSLGGGLGLPSLSFNQSLADAAPSATGKLLAQSCSERSAILRIATDAKPINRNPSGTAFLSRQGPCRGGRS